MVEPTNDPALNALIKAGELRRRRRWRAIKAIAAALVIIMIGAAYWIHGLLNPYPPKHNEDGSTDYTIVSRFGSDTYLWVLRMPQGTSAKPPADIDVSFSFGKSWQTLRSSKYWALNLDVDWPGFLPDRDPIHFNRGDDPSIYITLTDGTSLEREPLKRTEEELRAVCTEDRSDPSGLVRYINREPDLPPDEWQRKSFREQYGSCEAARLKGSGRYLGMDESGRPIVDIKCGADLEQCYAKYYFGRRRVMLFFGDRKLKDWKEIISSLESFLQRTTIRNDEPPTVEERFELQKRLDKQKAKDKPKPDNQT